MARSTQYHRPAPVSMNDLTVMRRLEEAYLAADRYGPPQIFNTDQGARFTSPDFVAVLERRGIEISNGWQSLLSVQHLHRAALAQLELGRSVRRGLCHSHGSTLGHLRLAGVLQ